MIVIDELKSCTGFLLFPIMGNIVSLWEKFISMRINFVAKIPRFFL